MRLGQLAGVFPTSQAKFPDRISILAIFGFFEQFSRKFTGKNVNKKNQNQRNKNDDQKIEFISIMLDSGAPKLWLTDFFPVFFKIKVVSDF